MKFVYRDTNVNYSYFDNSSKTSIIYLHGWGQNIAMMMPIAKPFIKKYNVLIIDLPGFGDSEEPRDVWSIYDYADMVYELSKSLKMKNPILIGHSFGGKISLVFASKYNCNKLVLLASPYKKKIVKDSLKTKVLKGMKKVPGLKGLAEKAKKYFGSTDYKNASSMMRKVLVNHVNLDVSDDAKKIKCPTLLIWGTKDEAVAYEDAIELEKLINNAGIVTYEGNTHYAYLERLNQTINVLKSFIGSDEK
jgi:pimeloyl-ACP methyl ester carboxylesterase